MISGLASRKIRKSFSVRELPNMIEGPKAGKGVHVFFACFLIFLGLGVVALFKSPASTYDFVFQTLGKPLEQMALGFSSSIKKDALDRTNILLLGVGGEKHDGGFLTDTNLVLSFNHNDKSIAMISIPRDLYSDIPGYGASRLNMIYSIGRAYYADKRDQFLMVDSVLEHILAIPIHYNALVNFEAVVDVVDILGGITVDVERAFTDKEYPGENYSYQTISFPAGLQTLDGDQALKFVRSRHANEALEQGDFARAVRQQKVLEALRRRALNLGVLTDPNKIKKIFNTIGENIETDITLTDIIGLAAIAKDINRDQINSLVLNDGPGGLLYTPTKEIREQYYGGSYLLLPDGGNFNAVHELVRNFLAAPNMVGEMAKLEFLNGTRVLGLADRASRPFKARGYQIINIDNTLGRKIYRKTYIIDRVNGKYPETLLELKKILPEAEITQIALEPNYSGVDITIVLGADIGSGSVPANYGPLESHTGDELFGNMSG